MTGGLEISVKSRSIPRNDDSEHEIGLILAMYHQKFGPRIKQSFFRDYELFSEKDRESIIRDAVSSDSERLNLYYINQRNTAYVICIQKFSYIKVSARGGKERYALILFVPQQDYYKPMIVEMSKITKILEKYFEKNKDQSISEILQKLYKTLNGPNNPFNKENFSETVIIIDEHDKFIKEEDKEDALF